MPKVKISEYSATANSNTDVASINIDEGCAPSGINNAIRAVMGHLKDFQQGTNGDPFNGPHNGTVGATTPSTGAFTTLSATGNVTLGDASTDTLNVGNGGLIKDASGNVGVGVTPSTINQGKGLEIFQAGYGLWNGTASTYVMANAYFNSGFKYGVTGQQATTYYQYQGTHVWNTAASGTAGNAITFTQAMTLDASGNLGIGTTSPTANRRLDAVISANVSAGIRVQNTNTGTNVTSNTTYVAGGNAVESGVVGSNYTTYGVLVANAAYTYVNNAPVTLAADGTGYITFGTGSGVPERARIDSSGNLLVGVTSTTQSHKFANKTAAAWTTQFVSEFSTASQNYGITCHYTQSAPNNTTNQFFEGQDNVGSRVVLRSNGGIANYSANDVNLSDRREKTNFAPAKSYLDVICAIPVQTFNYIDQNMEDDGGLTLGVVAQDVQAVAPELVMESNWAGKDEEPKMRLSIYQTDLQYALMKCIQEQQALITQLTARITALEGA